MRTHLVDAAASGELDSYWHEGLTPEDVFDTLYPR